MAVTYRPACSARTRTGQGRPALAPLPVPSIVVKVMRDRMMADCGRIHAHHGFEIHMGYATPAIASAIKAHGSVKRLH